MLTAAALLYTTQRPNKLVMCNMPCCRPHAIFLEQTRYSPATPWCLRAVKGDHTWALRSVVADAVCAMCPPLRARAPCLLFNCVIRRYFSRPSLKTQRPHSSFRPRLSRAYSCSPYLLGLGYKAPTLFSVDLQIG